MCKICNVKTVLLKQGDRGSYLLKAVGSPETWQVCREIRNQFIILKLVTPKNKALYNVTSGSPITS